MQLFILQHIILKYLSSNKAHHGYSHKPQTQNQVILQISFPKSLHQTNTLYFQCNLKVRFSAKLWMIFLQHSILPVAILRITKNCFNDNSALKSKHTIHLHVLLYEVLIKDAQISSKNGLKDYRQTRQVCFYLVLFLQFKYGSFNVWLKSFWVFEIHKIQKNTLFKYFHFIELKYKIQIQNVF